MPKIQSFAVKWIDPEQTISKRGRKRAKLQFEQEPNWEWWSKTKRQRKCLPIPNVRCNDERRNETSETSDKCITDSVKG